MSLQEKLLDAEAEKAALETLILRFVGEVANESGALFSPLPRILDQPPPNVQQQEERKNNPSTTDVKLTYSSLLDRYLRVHQNGTETQWHALLVAATTRVGALYEALYCNKNEVCSSSSPKSGVALLRSVAPKSGGSPSEAKKKKTTIPPVENRYLSSASVSAVLQQQESKEQQSSSPKRLSSGKELLVLPQLQQPTLSPPKKTTRDIEMENSTVGSRVKYDGSLTTAIMTSTRNSHPPKTQIPSREDTVSSNTPSPAWYKKVRRTNTNPKSPAEEEHRSPCIARQPTIQRQPCDKTMAPNNDERVSAPEEIHRFKTPKPTTSPWKKKSATAVKAEGGEKTKTHTLSPCREIVTDEATRERLLQQLELLEAECVRDVHRLRKLKANQAFS